MNDKSDPLENFLPRALAALESIQHSLSVLVDAQLAAEFHPDQESRNGIYRQFDYAKSGASKADGRAKGPERLRIGKSLPPTSAASYGSSTGDIESDIHTVKTVPGSEPLAPPEFGTRETLGTPHRWAQAHQLRA